jgi:hypothetical protein
MDPASTLLSLCEVAVSIAGFAGIAFVSSVVALFNFLGIGFQHEFGAYLIAVLV